MEHKKLPDRCQDIQLTLNQKQKIVRQVAFFLQNTDGGLKGNLIAQADLQAIVADYLRTLSLPNPEGWAEALIDALRVRNFTLCSAGTGYYAFVHRTFLEYFCATEIWERFNQRDSGSQNAISTDDLIHTIFGQHWNDDAWREVLILLASQLPIGFAKQAITSLVQLDHAISEKADFANLFLAADCLAELPERSSIAELDRDLLQRLRSLITWETLREVSSQEDWDFNQPTWKVREQAVRCVAQHWKDNPNTLPLLKERVLIDPSWSVRLSALEAIAQHWKDDPDTLPLLKEQVLIDEDWVVRYAAAQTIAQYWHDEPSTLPWLTDQAKVTGNSDVRQVSVEVIAQYWQGDTSTLKLLCEVATQDPFQRSDYEDREYEGNPRQTALEALLVIAPDNPYVFDLLRDRAANDPDDLFRAWAIQTFAPKDKPNTFPFLRERARADQDWYVRQVAVEAITQYWKDDLGTLPLLKERVCEDQDYDVRRTAVKAISQHWPNDSDAFNLLCKVATQDPFQRSGYEDCEYESNPRQTALEGLLAIAPENPQVMDLLRDRAANDPDDFLREWAAEQLARIDSQSHGA